jgi:hypothetical protein
VLACETHDTTGAVSTPAFGDAVTPATPGNELHGEAWSAGPEEGPSVSRVQRCLPLRRQQAGKPASGSDANAEGGISEKLNKPSNAIANALRTTAWYIRVERVVNLFRLPVLH